MNTIKTWCFDLITGEYTGTYNAPKDPKNPERYQIPAFATTVEPPEPAENQKVIWDGSTWKLEDIPEPEPEPKPEPTEEELRQREIWGLEGMLSEHQTAYIKLLTTGASQQELAECQEEIQAIIAELEAKYNESESA